jgi:hypothetical protein
MTDDGTTIGNLNQVLNYEEPYYVPYSSICSCNPINGGSGLCGCTMAGTMVPNPKRNITPIYTQATATTITYNQPKEQVDHPSHYGGKDNQYEAIKVIDAWNLGFSLGNTVKYISRAGKKDPTKEIEDLKKALFYLEHHIKTLEKKF